ncbi:MAG: 30S ribosome-binding factor RbfA [Woeseiaceae bacterium]
MPKDYSRTRRVGEQIQREMAQLVQQEIKDPRIGIVTISAVKLSKDMSHANVFFTVLESGNSDEAEADKKEKIDETLKVLEGAAGFLRHELAKRMQLRIIPHIHFKYDESISYGNDLSALINKAMGMENPENRMSDRDMDDDEQNSDNLSSDE